MNLSFHEMPSELLTCITKHKKPTRTTGAIESYNSAYLNSALDGEVLKVLNSLEGERNDTLNKAAFALAQLIDAGLSEENIRKHLSKAALASGLTSNEIEKTINSGIEAGIFQPRDIPQINRQLSKDNLKSTKRTLEPIPWTEINKIPSLEPLIKGFLYRSTLSIVYGPSNAGKTFFILSIALSIALGENWRDKKTRQGCVVYIAAEGGTGIKARLEAYKRYYNIEETDQFLIIPISIDLKDPDNDVSDLLSTLEKIDNLELIVVDTLSRCLAGGDENGPSDMTSFVANCDRIREETLAHVMVLHHPGKDITKGPRGHNSLTAASDTEIRLVQHPKTKIVTATVTKQRDGKTGDNYCAKLKVIPLGHDEDGDEISSCVLLALDVQSNEQKPLSKQRQRFIELLRQFLSDKGELKTFEANMNEVLCGSLKKFKDTLKKANIANSDKSDNIRRTISRLITELTNSGHIKTYKDFIWLADNSDKIGCPLIDKIIDQDG